MAVIAAAVAIVAAACTCICILIMSVYLGMLWRRCWGLLRDVSVEGALVFVEMGCIGQCSG
jgi:hypothetical protein